LDIVGWTLMVWVQSCELGWIEGTWDELDKLIVLIELSWTNGLDDIRMIWMDTLGVVGTIEMHHEVHLLDMI
jgi:hypothetical protein